MNALFNEEPGERVSGAKRPRLVAWIHEHDSHGLMYDTPIWMPEGDKPEEGLWIRAHWMDQPVSHEPVRAGENLTPEQKMAEQIWHFLLQSGEVSDAIERAFDAHDAALMQEQIAAAVLQKFKLEGRRIPW